MLGYAPLVKIHDDQIVINMRDNRYHAALVLLTELAAGGRPLSRENQFRMLVCLYHTRKYRTVIEKSRQFSEAGNSTTEILFLRALSHFQLGQFPIARQFFSHSTDWARWAKKASIKTDCSPSRIVVIGELPQKFETDDVELGFSETPAAISITFPLRGIDPDDLKITVGVLWFDVLYEDPTRRFALYYELFDRVIPNSAVIENSPETVVVNIEKQKEGIWGCLVREDSIESSIGPHFEDLVSKLDLHRDLSDEVASEEFERSVNLSREEVPDISSWFVDS
jgi:hypothetical protein